MPGTLFITGASSGIGAVTARAASAAGWNVALFARSADKLGALTDDIGAAALALPGDVTDPDALEAAVTRTVERFGGLDAAFANAGRGISASATENATRERLSNLIDVNVMGVLWTARAVMPELRRTQGTLVLTGSGAGRRHLPGSVYGATKWFVHGYAGNMAEAMREWGGRCTVVAPGMVDTPFFDEARPDKLKPEDVADAVMHAISAAPRAAVREIYLMPQN